MIRLIKMFLRIVSEMGSDIITQPKIAMVFHGKGDDSMATVSSDPSLLGMSIKGSIGRQIVIWKKQ